MRELVLRDYENGEVVRLGLRALRTSRAGSGTADASVGCFSDSGETSSGIGAEVVAGIETFVPADRIWQIELDEEVLKGADREALAALEALRARNAPAMTAEWENTLMEIERGKADADAFLSGIVRMTGDLVKAYPFLSDAEAQRFGTGKEEIGKCPRCGSPVYVGKGNFYCSNKECSFCLWEDNKFFSSKKKKLTKRIAKELLDKGWCRVTGLYTPKKPQLYNAVIRLDDSGGKYVSFKMEFDR